VNFNTFTFIYERKVSEIFQQLLCGFCRLLLRVTLRHLGDMLSIDGDADAAVETTIRIDGINSGSW